MIPQIWRCGQQCYTMDQLFIILSSCRHLCCHRTHRSRPICVGSVSKHTGSGRKKCTSRAKQIAVINNRFFSISHVRYTSQGYKLKNNLKDCYSLLNISEDCSLAELKEAYIRLAKLYHPDTQSSTADPKKFDQVRDAYQTVKANFEEQAILEGLNVADDDDDDDDLFSTKLKPQHRQYLDKEGIGFGTNQQRQKQYDQFRISKAQDKVFGYKVKRLTPEGENALVAKDQRAARRNKIRSQYEKNDPWLQVKIDWKRNSMERIVEDLIQESMSRGDFKDLGGAGKPLKFEQDSPYMDKITKKLNQILIDESTQPEWIMLHKEIRSDLNENRQKLAAERKRLGEPPYNGENLKHWEFFIERFNTTLEDINMRIDKFNLICPVLSKQMIPYDFVKERDKICQNPDKFLPADFSFQEKANYSELHGQKTGENVTMKQIWEDFKDIFKRN